MNKEDILAWDEPLVFKKVLDWKVLKWTEPEWRIFLEQNENKYPIRKGTFNCSSEPQWERNCSHEKMKMSDFLSILFGPPRIYWYYFDYKHIAEWFGKTLHQLDMSWKCVGFPEKTARDSTLWMGSQGAHTPCHVDSYGCNFVAQLYGRKTWLLFNPLETSNLKPTRVPYEESSIYSDFNYFCGCNELPRVSEGKVICLEPGDVLYVPKRWWHFVQNETSAISVNTWIPLESDNKSRVEESLVKLFISNVVKDMDEESAKQILNPNEDDVIDFSLQQSFQELNYCLKNLTDSSNRSKKHYLERFKLESIKRDQIRNKIKSCCLKQQMVDKNQNTQVGYKEIINAFCHPHVINLVSNQICGSII